MVVATGFSFFRRIMCLTAAVLYLALSWQFLLVGVMFPNLFTLFVLDIYFLRAVIVSLIPASALDCVTFIVEY